MDPWAWIAAYLVGFAFLQLLLYRYFRRDAPRTEAATPGGAEASPSAASAGGGPAEEGAVTCPECGAVNERDGSYTFCQRCVAPLR